MGHQNGKDRLAEIGMGQADHGGFQHAGGLVQQHLDLDRIDVEPARDHQILGAADDMHIAIIIDPAQITGDKPAIRAQVLGRLFGHLPIASKDVGAAHLDPAHSTLGDPLAIGHQAQIDAGQRQAHRARPPLSVIGVGGVHVGFGHPVAFQNAVAGAGLKRRMRFGQQRGRAGNEQPHRRGQGAVKARIVQKPGVKGRHPHQNAGLWQKPQHRFDVKAGQKDHLAAGQQGYVCGDKKSVGVKNRQGMQQGIGGGKPPEIRQNAGIGQQVPVAEHRAFGAARGARGVQDRCQIIGAARGHGGGGMPLGKGGETALSCRVHGAHRNAQRRGHRRQSRQIARIADQQARGGVLQKIVNLFRGIGRVQRQKHRAHPHRRAVQRQGLRGFVHLHRQPVAGAQSGGDKAGHGSGNQVMQGLTGHGGSVRQMQNHVTPLRQRGKERVKQRVHRPGPFAGGQGADLHPKATPSQPPSRRAANRPTCRQISAIFAEGP